MGNIRRAIADFIRSRRVDDKRHPRFQAGYLAGLYDARLEAETTHEDGIIRLEKWPEEHVLWYHGEIVWRSGPGTMPEVAAPWAVQHVAPPKNSGNLWLEVRSNPCAGDPAYGGADPRALKYDTSRALPPHDPDIPAPSTYLAAPQCCMCGKKNLSTVEGDGGSECELVDGRWVCSAECWDRAVEPAQHVTVADYATRLFDLHGFMLLETYRGKHAVTVQFPDLQEAQQFHNTLIELSQRRPAAALEVRDNG